MDKSASSVLAYLICFIEEDWTRAAQLVFLLLVYKYVSM